MRYNRAAVYFSLAPAHGKTRHEYMNARILMRMLLFDPHTEIIALLNRTIACGFLHHGLSQLGAPVEHITAIVLISQRHVRVVFQKE